MNQPIRIAFFMRGGHYWVGGREYIENLILALATCSSRDGVQLFVISDEELSPLIKSHVEKIQTKNFNDNSGKLSFIKYVPYLEGILLDRFIDKQKIDFVYPYYSYRKIPVSFRSAAWIADFQYKHLPEYFTSEEIAQREKETNLKIKYADNIVLSSNVAENHCHQYFPASKEKTRVLHFRTAPQGEWYQSDPVNVQRKYNLPDKYFIVCNQFWQHKNHMLLFKALKVLKCSGIYPFLVCTGHLHDSRFPGYSDDLLSSLHEHGISNHVAVLGLIPKFDQIQLIRRSISVIQPSLFEGWSTVVENIRCFGKPAILSDIPVHKEQALPSAEYFKKNSVDELSHFIGEQWESFSPGPDLNREKEAYTRQLDLVKQYGKDFLEINQLA